MASPLDIALDYIARGWNPTPVQYRNKRALGDGWQLRIIDATNAAQFFNGEKLNIGAVLGPSSRKLTDVDEDAAEAIYIGPYILPKTKARFGRASKRDSHRLYYTELSAAGLPAAIAFDDPRKPKQQGRLIELRIGGNSGAQTVLPGSVHKSGEAITWEEDGEPATVDGNDLLQRVKTVAAYSLLARYWPAEGSGHHDTARVVGGFLARASLDPKTIRVHVEAIVRATNSPRWKELCRTAEDAAQALAAGKHGFGFTGLQEAFGADIAKKVAEWLNYPQKARRSDGKIKTEKPADTEDADELPPEAEDAIALAFAGRHANELRYVNAWGKWVGFENAHWIEDNTLHTFDRVRAVCREIATTGEHSPRVVASAKTIVAVERLARADRRLAATAEQWDNNSWMLNEKNRG
jgi:hypothetical protein